MNAGSEQKPPDANENKNALDFFNNDDGNGALGNAAAFNAQNQQPAGGDLFSFDN